MSLELERIRVDGVSNCTLVGFSKNGFPLKRGNCFSVYRGQLEPLDIDKPYYEYRVLNFNYENLEHLLETKVVSWPIGVVVYEKRFALIHDTRIPNEYYQKHFCEVCCPEDLLPMPQRLALDRMILRGEREIFKSENGFTWERRMIEQSTKTIPDFKYTVAADMVNLVGLDVETEMVNAITSQMLAEEINHENR